MAPQKILFSGNQEIGVFKRPISDFGPKDSFSILKMVKNIEIVLKISIFAKFSYFSINLAFYNQKRNFPGMALVRLTARKVLVSTISISTIVALLQLKSRYEFKNDVCKLDFWSFS